jgi:hypothetical protein
MRPIRGRHVTGFNLLSSFMGPLLIGGGGRMSNFLREEPEIVVDTGFPGSDSEGVSVEGELRVEFRETAVDIERDSVGVYGFA